MSAVAIVDRSLVEHFGYELQKASSAIPSFKGPQLVMLGHVGQSLPSQPVLAELGCCACFSRPPRQAYLRDALSVALSGGSKLIRMKPDFTLDTGICCVISDSRILWAIDVQHVPILMCNLK